MSRAVEAQQLLHAASKTLDEVVQAFTATTEPEELQNLQQAEASETGAEDLMAQAQAAETAEQMAELLRQAEELARQAEALRRQAGADLLARAGAAQNAEDAAKETLGQTQEAVGGTTAGDDIVTAVAAIGDAAAEVAGQLFGAAEMATDRGQTGQCLGLISQAYERSGEVCGMCEAAQQAITDYVARL